LKVNGFSVVFGTGARRLRITPRSNEDPRLNIYIVEHAKEGLDVFHVYLAPIAFAVEHNSDRMIQQNVNLPEHSAPPPLNMGVTRDARAGESAT
jgi:hypothetical protein